MKNDKLILTPISQIFQFRHDFSNINKEKTLSLKIKGKKDQKNIGIKKEEKDDIKFSPLYPHLPNSIESKIMLEKISNLEGEPQKANFMNKDDYFNFLLKYVITPDTEGDTNDDFLALYKNTYSNSFLESVKENKNEEENMIIEEKIKEGKKSSKKSRGFNSGLDVIKNIDKDNIKSDGNYGIVNNIINNIFENEECIEYDNLLMNICQKMGIEIIKEKMGMKTFLLDRLFEDIEIRNSQTKKYLEKIVRNSGGTFGTSSTDIYRKKTIENIKTKLEAGEDITIKAGNKITLQGTDITSDGTINLISEKDDINIVGVLDYEATEHSKKESGTLGLTGMSKTDIKEKMTLNESVLNAKGGINISGGNDTNIFGSNIYSDNDITIQALNYMNIGSMKILYSYPTFSC